MQVKKIQWMEDNVDPFSFATGMIIGMGAVFIFVKHGIPKIADVIYRKSVK